jgi:Zn-dependent metalloprotease
MKMVSVERYADGNKVRFTHLLFDTPVWEDSLEIDINKNGVVGMVSSIVHPNLEKQLFNRSMHPAISGNQAIKRALSEMHGTLADKPRVEKYYLASRPGTPLVYIVTLQFKNQDKTTTVIVHSLTGRVIENNSSTFLQ